MGFALTVTAGPDEGRRYVFDDEATLGRTGETDVVVQDAAASRLHARIFEKKPGKYFLEDSGSANGTLLNGDKVKRPAELMDGDVVSIGAVELTFEYIDAADVEDEANTNASQEDLYSTMDTSDAPLQGTMFGDDLGSLQSMPSLPPRPAPRVSAPPRASPRRAPPPESEEAVEPVDEAPPEPPSPPRPRRDATSTRSRARKPQRGQDRSWFITKLVVGVILVGALIGTAIWALPILLAPPAP